ncbi:magnesium transporter CorA [Chitinophaga agrisoli]|uniref:Magnesium transporter CorA n=1 Tax=Chitinophaga agrisoli TaxID=2607653 RepID=A0A5B2VY27_9BACT|nr:CorA family divalent cation transporter [Chitinophaga agrisoli]KAA2242939.1 magnesium transporter CorA [Chitinophaga agrisoli]
MIQEMLLGHGSNFKWINVTMPTDEEIRQISLAYQIPPSLLSDCGEMDQLPKYERVDNYVLVVFRINSINNVAEADSIQELSDPIYLVYSDDLVLSVCYKRAFLSEPSFKPVLGANPLSSLELVNLLLVIGLKTYLQSLDVMTTAVDYFEKDIFLMPNNVPILKGLYYLKRKADIFKRIFVLSAEVVRFLHAQQQTMDSRDVLDQHTKLHNSFDVLADNVHQLLNIYFSVSSQRTNETMRVLTIFSVFFLPLSFIVGLYGMNFNIPETKWSFGYPMVVALLVAVTVLIFLWFKRRRLL